MKIFVLILTLLRYVRPEVCIVKTKRNIFSNFCGLLRIFKLCICVEIDTNLLLHLHVVHLNRIKRKIIVLLIKVSTTLISTDFHE